MISHMQQSFNFGIRELQHYLQEYIMLFFFNSVSSERKSPPLRLSTENIESFTTPIICNISMIVFLAFWLGCWLKIGKEWFASI